MEYVLDSILHTFTSIFAAVAGAIWAIFESILLTFLIWYDGLPPGDKEVASLFILGLGAMTYFSWKYRFPFWGVILKPILWPLRYTKAAIILLLSPFGSARWATLRQIKKARLNTFWGLVLGEWRSRFGIVRQTMQVRGEGHLITIAAPGGGKSSAAVIPTLLECREGSLVVTDPKGELTAVTHEFRKTISHVVYLNPFYKDFQKHTGLDYTDTGFNPFDAIEDGENIRALADNFARLLCVTDRQESGSYFQDEGAELLSLFITWMVRHEPPENRNLAYLYELVRRDPQEILRFVDYADDPLIHDDALRFRAMFKDSPGQWAGAISKAQLATKRYVPTTPLANHTSKSGFDPMWLKSQNVTVYILLPSEHVQTAAPWLNLVIGLLGETVGRAGEASRVTFLLDELPALGYLPDLRTQMRQYRSAGLRMWLFSQTVAALADREMYGKEGVQDLFGLCDTKQFFSIREPETASEISRMCGETTRKNRNLNSQNEGLSTVGVPLIRPEEILKLGKGQQIILRPNLPPIKAWLMPYFQFDRWKEKAGINPYLEEVPPEEQKSYFAENPEVAKQVAHDLIIFTQFEIECVRRGYVFQDLADEAEQRGIDMRDFVEIKMKEWKDSNTLVMLSREEAMEAIDFKFDPKAEDSTAAEPRLHRIRVWQGLSVIVSSLIASYLLFTTRSPEAYSILERVVFFVSATVLISGILIVPVLIVIGMYKDIRRIYQWVRR